MSWKKGYRLRFVPESQAEGRTAEVYSEVKELLGLPQVSLFFQAMAAYPAFFDLHWRALQPLAQTCEFFKAAERLNADAYTRMHSYFEISDLRAPITAMKFSEGACAELSETVELYTYENPLVLLLAGAQLLAFEGRTADSGPGSPVRHHPVFPQLPLCIEEESAQAAVGKIYEDVRHTLEFPALTNDFRALARWPDFLRLYWDVLKPIVQSPMYAGIQHGLRDTALGFARDLPPGIDLSPERLEAAGVGPEDIPSVLRITEAFVRLLTSQVLNLAVAKIALEGGSRAAVPAEAADIVAAPGKPERAA